MMPFKKCPICGVELKEKEVEKLLRGGNHTASVKVQAEVCLHCGERLYEEKTVRFFQMVRNRLEREKLFGFEPLGKSFKIDSKLQSQSIEGTKKKPCPSA
jgi:YgiT-type zinc finger domain-containing protein